jgi:hypothetical protein
MKQLNVIVISVILLISFLWASTGVTVYSHYCSLSDSVNTSIFLDDANCDHHDEQLAAASCCEKNKSCTSEMNDTDCCDTQKQVFRIASLFNLPDKSKKLDNIDVVLLTHYLTDFEVTDELDSELPPNTEQQPPGSYGKELLLTIQQQKIAPAPII